MEPWTSVRYFVLAVPWRVASPSKTIARCRMSRRSGSSRCVLGNVVEDMGSTEGKLWRVHVAVERKGFGGGWKGRRDSAAGVGGGGMNWSFKTGVVAVDERAASLYDWAMVAAGASGVDAGRDSVASPRANT